MSNDNQLHSSDVWMYHMRRGEFEEAWKFSDAVLKARGGKVLKYLPRPYQNFWNGSPLNEKRVLVRCYHGLGDTIQFIRYMPMIKAIAKEVIVFAQPEILSLLQTAKGIDKLLPLHDGDPDAAYDTDIEIMECQHIFRTKIETIPAEIPYLYVEPKRLSLNNKKIAVGLVWRSGEWDERRNIPFHLLAPLAEIKDIDLYILQANAKAAGWQEGVGIHPGEFNLYNYAEVIKGLDLMISVDSMPAHLAGALGVPVWNLLHSEPDWRWMKDRDDSPWYPTMRLFRQQVAGDWKPVIQHVVNALKDFKIEKTK